jgi:DNA adenine methylase
MSAAFAGSAAVLLAKRPVSIEVVNDINGDLVSFYRTLRNPSTRDALIDALRTTPYARAELLEACGPSDGVDEVEAARRFMVRSNQTFVGGGGTTQWVATLNPTSQHSNATKWSNYIDRLEAVAARLRAVQIENTDAVGLLRRVVKSGNTSNTAVYIDPPYPSSTRNGSSYRSEMTDDQHGALLEVAVTLRGPTVISTYPNPQYDEALGAAGWVSKEIGFSSSSNAGSGSVAARTEVIWANPACEAKTDYLF